MDTIGPEKRLETDVLVIGGGIAGCFAAIKAREQGASVILVDKGFAGKSGQSPYARNFMAFNPDWGHSLDAWMSYINKTSEYVNNRYWTEVTIKESYVRPGCLGNQIPGGQGRAAGSLLCAARGHRPTALR